MKRALWIKGYEGKYKILPDGKIYSFIHNKQDGKLLIPRISGSGYLMVSLSGKQAYIHKLVAQHYLINPNKRKFKFVVFKDGNSNNIKVSNLVWTDSAGKGKQRCKNDKKIFKAEGMVNSYISNEQLIDIARLIKNSNIKNKFQTISNLFGIHRITLYRLRKTTAFKKALLKL